MTPAAISAISNSTALGASHLSENGLIVLVCAQIIIFIVLAIVEWRMK